ncbi:MAG: hypothetical protein EXR09_08025 [Acetobacteraceae bacterium]|nr:hypothetical protein [Acetobacteraceae bacterium]
MATIKMMSHHALLTGLGAVSLLITGCQDPPGNRPRVYAVDMAGAAKSCAVSAVDLSGGKSADATMAVGNDGGWCAIAVSQSAGEAPSAEVFGGRGLARRKPYTAGLVQTRAQRGQLQIHTVGDETRVDYTPDHGFTGTDHFAVQLLPNNSVMKVAVTVVPK